MSDTPLTDRLESIMDHRDTAPIDKLPQYADLCRELERKLCTTHDLVEGDADGTPDASDYEHLCNRIEGIISAP